MATNTQEFGIEMTSVPNEYLKDVLRALLHSIFFHRLLVNVTPRELRVLDTTVSITDSREVENLIEDKANEFIQSLQTNIKQGKIAVLFYEKRLKKNWFQFSKSEEFVCWEQWALTIGLAYPETEQERQRVQKACEHQLSQCLLSILKLANDHKEHIPSITTTDGNPFPYQIAIPSKSESWSSMIKRLLVTDAPMTDTFQPTISRSSSSSTVGSNRPPGSSKSGY
ncbi:uncharacterized protein BX664DRAFT_331604 [Halteromyces radiatus]|uniref:uncharacterized protein n=1 Tax=Halteromyces radiatus TaxID=101107 RepID=UPI00221F13AE|nr:uncharacterized protein BX664DRAFT_331604 [Halteromyces radiatus]KAI8088865.1 hypothetical protein BX664DRAFT_331604 [Halteromyces radiatus]